MSRIFEIAVIGCGYWGGNYVRIFDELDGVRVAAISDKRESMLDRFRSLGPDVLLTTDAREAIRADVDAVVVCTQASQHYAVTVDALQQAKHVLVEKPLTTCSSEARALSASAGSAGLVLMVGHTFMFNAGIRILKQYVDDGSIGDL